MKKLILCILLYSPFSFTKPVVLAVQELNKSESAARISAVEGIPYSNYVLEKLRHKAIGKNLVHSAARIRLAELSKDQEIIFNHCNEIYKARYDADWGNNDRKLIQYCIQKLRLLSTDPRKQLGLKHEAQAFSEDQLITARLNDNITENYKWILINGRQFQTAQRSADIPKTYFRMTLISDRSEAVTKVINAEQLARWSHLPKSLTSGDCKSGFRYESRQLSSQDLPSAIVASRNCKVKITKSHPIQKNFSQKKPISLKIPKWAWWVAGGALGYTVYKNNQSDRGKQQPSSKRGF